MCAHMCEAGDKTRIEKVQQISVHVDFHRYRRIIEMHTFIGPSSELFGLLLASCLHFTPAFLAFARVLAQSLVAKHKEETYLWPSVSDETNTEQGNNRSAQESAKVPPPMVSADCFWPQALFGKGTRGNCNKFKP